MASSSMETSGIVHNRLQQYKAGSKTEPEDIRITRKLLEGIKLRRKERDDQFARRREIGSSSDDDSTLDEEEEQPFLLQGCSLVQEDMAEQDKMDHMSFKEEDQIPFSPEELKELAELLHSDDEEHLWESVMYFKDFVSQSDSVSIHTFKELGILARFFQLVLSIEDPYLYLQAVPLVLNIACSASEVTDLKVLVDAGAVPTLIELSSSDINRFNGKALQALGNIAAACPELRDYLVDHGLVPALVKYGKDLDLVFCESIDTLSSLLSNLCKFKPHCDLEKILPLFQVLEEILESRWTDSSVLSACWAVAFLADGNDAEKQAILDSKLCPLLVDLLGWREAQRVSLTIVATFGTIARGNMHHTEAVLNLGILPCLEDLVHSQDPTLKREVFCFVSNVLAGTHEQIQRVIDGGLIQSAVRYLSEDSPEVQKECCLCLCNLFARGSTEQKRYAATPEVVHLMCTFLNAEDEQVVLCVLGAFECVLKAGVGRAVTDAFKEVDFKSFDYLKLHPNGDIRRLYQSLHVQCVREMSQF